MTNHLEVADLMAENERLRDSVARREDLCGRLIGEIERIRSAQVCKKCGAETQHYCGMACVDMCPKCDVLR